MIARAFVKQDPIIMWGTGEQARNWAYVSDTVDGTILAAEKIDNGTAVNLGTMERARVIDAAKEILRRTTAIPSCCLIQRNRLTRTTGSATTRWGRSYLAGSPG